MRASASGAHATVVGQKAVTPYRGSRAAIAATGLLAVAIERVKPLDAVHVDVDEARHDVMMMRRRRRGTRPAAGRRSGTHVDNAIAVDDKSAGREDPVRQHQMGARQNDHGGASRGEACGADGRGVGAERRRRDGERLHHRPRQPARQLGANRLEQQIGGCGHDAAEHEPLGIRDDDEVGRGHPEILRRVAHHGDRHTVAVSRRAQHVDPR